jgi:phosphohistidine phosphatase
MSSSSGGLLLLRMRWKMRAMNVLLVRHAKAADPETMADAHRPLTARGRRDALTLGKALRHAGVNLDALVTSPLVRAVETAELLAVGIEFDEALEVSPALSPSQPSQAVIEQVLHTHGKEDLIAVVGHEPQLGLLLRDLIGGYAPGLRKASAVLVDWPAKERPGRFEWVLHPDLDKPSKRFEDIG